MYWKVTVERPDGDGGWTLVGVYGTDDSPVSGTGRHLHGDTPADAAQLLLSHVWPIDLATFNRYQGTDLEQLQAIGGEDPNLTRLLRNAEWAVLPVRQITGYSANVSSLWGPGYALLGNAGEFLDPVFSSGVTIAFKSAQLALIEKFAPKVQLRKAG